MPSDFGPLSNNSSTSGAPNPAYDQALQGFQKPESGVSLSGTQPSLADLGYLKPGETPAVDVSETSEGSLTHNHEQLYTSIYGSAPDGGAGGAGTGPSIDRVGDAPGFGSAAGVTAGSNPTYDQALGDFSPSASVTSEPGEASRADLGYLKPDTTTPVGDVSTAGQTLADAGVSQPSGQALSHDHEALYASIYGGAPDASSPAPQPSQQVDLSP